MSLYLYFSDENLHKGLDVIWDIEAYFRSPSDVVHPAAKAVLAEVEGAVPSSTSKARFVDRFGGELYWSFLSTGTKAAFVLADNPGKCVSLLECGHNAVLSVVKNFKDGAVLIEYPTYGMPDGSIDVVLHGKHFTDGSELWEYIDDECLSPKEGV